MPQSKLYRRVPHRPDDLLSLVRDVENYPKFIDLMSQTRITRHQKISETHEQFEADAVISYKFLNETFRSVVDVYSDQRKVRVSKPGRSGAVKVLSNEWVMHPLSDGSTLVEFAIDVQLKARPLDMMLRGNFNQISQHVIGLFSERASTVFERVGTDTIDLKDEYARLGLAHAYRA